MALLAATLAVSAGLLAGCSAVSQARDANTFPVVAPNALGGPDTSLLVAKRLDIAYANQSDAQKLDIYLPDQGSRPFPVIVAIHGGGFRTGDKADDQLAPMLTGLERGYAVVAINYRLSDEAHWPAQINDAKGAIRFLRANAETYGIDPTRVAVWGDSAGGDLAALLGTSGGVDALADLGQGNVGESDRVQAVVDWFGPIDYERLEAQYRNGGGGSGRTGPRSAQAQLFGLPLSAVPGKMRAANPETYITLDDPPFLIEHGTSDGTIPVEQSKEFAAELTERLGSDKVTLRLLDGAGHMDPAFMTPENLGFVLDWLDARMR